MTRAILSGAVMDRLASGIGDKDTRAGRKVALMFAPDAA